jgi:hypothetical protein
MVTAASYVIGCWLVAMGVYKLKQATASQMYQTFDIKGPLTTIIVGTFLIFLPAVFQSLTESTFKYDGIMGYEGDGSLPQEFETVLYYGFEIMKLVGVVAFIRGCYMLSKLADSNHGQGMSGGKALTHMFGGLFSYHLYTFFLVLEETFK